MSLNASEAQRGTDAFFMTIYGIELHKKWKELKKKMNFVLERDFVNWMLDYIISREDVDGSDGYEYVEVMPGGDYEMKLGEQTSDEVAAPDADFDQRAGDAHSSVVTCVLPEKTDIPTLSEHNSGVHACERCGTSFSNKSQLLLHGKQAHGETPNTVLYRCEYCSSYVSTRVSDVLRHEILRHNRESKYKCGTCGKYWYTPSQLKNHEKVHEMNLIKVKAQKQGFDV